MGILCSFVVMFTGKIVSTVSDAVTSTNLGQYVIRKLDALLWTLEKPARYCIDGKDMDVEVTSPVFWIVLAVLQICRVSVSKILTKLSQKPIETEDIVRRLVKWRRALRFHFRFGGVFHITESETDESNGNSRNLTSSPIPIQSNLTRQQKMKRNRRRKYDDSLDYDLLEDLMNRTFSDNDDLDSTFTISRVDDASMTCSSIGQSYLDCLPGSTVDIHSLHNETLPIAWESDSEQRVEPEKPKEMSFASTDESAFMMSRDVSSSSLNEESSTISESGNSQNGKEAVKQPVDPTDAMISKFVHQKDVKTNNRWDWKSNQSNKKNSKSSSLKFSGGVSKNTTKASLELVNRHQSMKNTKSHELGHD